MSDAFDIYDQPIGQSLLSGVSGSDEWKRLSPWYRRAIALSVETPGCDLREALSLPHARDVSFSDDDLPKAVEQMLGDPDIQTILKVLTTRTTEIGVRRT